MEFHGIRDLFDIRAEKKKVIVGVADCSSCRTLTNS